VLIVDDNEDNRCVLMDALDGEGYALSEAFDGQDALEQIHADAPDLVLLDIMMPRIDGVECCRRLKADARTRDIPVILVTALDAEQHVVAGLDAGATDYVSKPFARPVVQARVRAALRSKFAVEALHSKNDEIQHLAFMLERSNEDLKRLALHDGLTDLPNRMLLSDRLAHAIERKRRDPALKFALLFLDFNRFKRVNDTMGHEAGDELLKSIAERLRDELRGVDTVASPAATALPSRLGGDEFVALVEGYGQHEDLEWIVQRVSASLARPHIVKGRELVCTASIGIVTAERDYDSPDAMLRDADAAMYRAKGADGRRPVYFDDGMHQDLIHERDLEQRLQAVASSGGLTLLYDPIVRLEDGRLHAFEAVVRWPQPGGTSLGPSAFMPLAAQADLILPLSRAILEEACTRLASLPPVRAGAPFRMVLETRDEQLREPGFVDLVTATLTAAQLDPARLILRVSENALRSDADALQPALAALRARGVQLAVNGYEQGCFALARPGAIEVVAMRLDRAATRHSGNRHYAAILHSVITLAHNLGIRVTAADLQDTTQLAQLQALDCDLGQGPLFGGPFGPDECERLASADRIEVQVT
jgi:diguanylate cyclase (GGDEF)-like protein